MRVYLLRLLVDLLVHEDPLHSLSEFPLFGNLCLSHLVRSREVRLLELWLLFRHADDPEDPAEPLKGLERQARYLLMAPETLESQNSYTYWLAAVAAVVSCCCCCLLLVMSATVAAVVSFSLGTCYPSAVSCMAE